MVTEPEAMKVLARVYRICAPIFVERLNHSRYCEGDSNRVAGLIATECVAGVGPKNGRIRYLRLVVDESTAADRIAELQIRPPKIEPAPIRQQSYGDIVTGAAAWQERLQQEYARNLRECQGSHTPRDWADVLRRYGNKCLRCGLPGDEFPITKDHVVPISRGGTNNASNLQPLCGPCNSWKGAREIDFRS